MQYDILLEVEKLQVYTRIDLGLEQSKNRVVNTQREDRTINS